MLFTGKGDDGTTGLFNSPHRVPKHSSVTEALGAADELNSLLGICYAKAREMELGNACERLTFHGIIRDLQEDLFIIQAELAGAPKSIKEKRVGEIENIIRGIEKELPPLESFTISGEFLLSAYLDYARSVSRRMERRVVALVNTKEQALSPATLRYCNRLSSILYALARLAAVRANVREQSPHY